MVRLSCPKSIIKDQVMGLTKPIFGCHEELNLAPLQGD
jgi:hypothetical protein